mmetsp:Transcript_28626/g.68909  ORF Transcript_28626/g.68909 Transcript_28626/m.68909 type:complete len:83 (+) Transcript_28626:1108-1356(+)
MLPNLPVMVILEKLLGVELDVECSSLETGSTTGTESDRFSTWGTESGPDLHFLTVGLPAMAELHEETSSNVLLRAASGEVLS